MAARLIVRPVRHNYTSPVKPSGPGQPDLLLLL